MAAYGTKLNEKFAAMALKYFYQSSVADSLVNRDYEGEIKGVATKVNILTLSKLTWGNYTGADISPQDLNEVAGALTIGQQKDYYFKVKNIDKLKSFVKNPEGTVIDQLGMELKKIVDTYVLGFYGDVAAGNRYGTDYTTGTVTVDVTTGAVTGSGTTFTSAMVGRGFKATGHTSWYRVKSYSSSTAIVIEDDSDDVASAYTGGAIGAGAAYTIEAATKKQVSKTTIYADILALRQKLDSAEIPMENRWLVVPSMIGNIIRQAPELIPAVPTAYEDVVKKGILGTIGGFKVYESERVSGDNTNGFRVLAGHPAWMTMAEAMVDNEVEPWISGNFGVGFKGLYVYDVKVLDERRKCAAEGFWYV